ncbi:2-oxoacid:acceptor oxidoreductase family protein [Thermodesulfobacteriota bacterium]
MKEIRLHGRGGQGVVIAAEILVTALVIEGKYAAGFPFFGFERRGAPVRAFVRFDDEPIREKTQVYTPDCLMVMDPKQISSQEIFAGLKPQGILVANHPNEFTIEKPHNLEFVGVVDASGIALKEIGIPVPNTCMVGAFAAATGWVKKDSVLMAMEDFFKGSQLDKNLRCAAKGYELTKVLPSNRNSRGSQPDG